MRTSALFNAKVCGFFEIYGVSARARWERGGQFFAILCGRLLWRAHCFFDFLPLNLLLNRSHQAEIIIVKRLIQGRNNVYDEGEGWT